MLNKKIGIIGGGQLGKIMIIVKIIKIKGE